MVSLMRVAVLLTMLIILPINQVTLQEQFDTIDLKSKDSVEVIMKLTDDVRIIWLFAAYDIIYGGYVELIDKWFIYRNVQSETLVGTGIEIVDTMEGKIINGASDSTLSSLFKVVSVQQKAYIIAEGYSMICVFDENLTIQSYEPMGNILTRYFAVVDIEDQKYIFIAGQNMSKRPYEDFMMLLKVEVNGTLNECWKLHVGFDGQPVIGDIDADLELEILALNGESIDVYSLGNGSFEYYIDLSMQPHEKLMLVDADGDGELEILSWDQNGVVLFELDGSHIWHIETHVYDVAYGDIDWDGRMEMIICGGEGIKVINAEDGSTLWVWNSPPTSNPVLADINNDSKIEIIFTNTTHLCILDWTGKLLYSARIFDAQVTGSGILVWDINKNSLLDIAYYGSRQPKSETEGYYLGVLEIEGSGKRIYWNKYQTEEDFVEPENQLFIDKDMDMLSDYSELVLGTALGCPDTDGDGIPDGWEIANMLDPLDKNDATKDYDRDGLNNIDEYIIGGDPYRKDKDEDGLEDKYEPMHNTDPSDPDTDNDYLLDGLELNYGLDPLCNDTDGDGMPDGWEVMHGLNATDPVDASLDLDEDGLTNLEEYHYGTNPANPDTDGDYMPDYWEVMYGLSATDPDDADIDPDEDGLINLEEYRYGTDPMDPDTDGDGYSDGYEVSCGTDPLDPNDYPVPFIKKYWWVLAISIATIVVLVVFLYKHGVLVRKVEI